MHRLREPLLLFAIIVLAVAIRGVDLNGPCFYTDEVNELALAKQSVTNVIFAADSMPPLYALVHKAWLASWGTDAAARWLSVVFGVATVVCVWGIGRRLVDASTGLAAAFLLAILPLHVLYSQFVRSYAMFAFFVALALWMLLRAVASDRARDWCGFVLASLAGAYTHYYFAIFLAVSLLVVVIMKRSLRVGKRALIAYVAIALGGLPLLYLLPGDFHFQTSLRDPQRLTAVSFAYTYLTFFTGDALGPSSRELHSISVGEAARGMAPWAAAIGIAALALGLEGWRALRSRPALPVLALLLVMPPLLVGGLGYAAGVNYHVRFVLWILIPLAVWLGAGLAAAGSRWHVELATLGIACISIIAIYNRHCVPRYQNEDLRGAAAYLHTHADQGQPVFVVSDYLSTAARYYLEEPWQVVELPRPGGDNNVIAESSDLDVADATLSASAKPKQPFWLIYSREFHGDPKGLLLKHLSAMRHLSLAAEFAGVALYRSD
ncbi:MAG TPA: glycosyltransferase family 39 protein [Lacipirellulaceae bacterium]|jgi:4-amino-4-deoxy-L-arabinose transferase-like glycosyltransferase